MKQSNEDDAIREIYQDLLKEELRLPELKKEKKAFIEEHFKPEPIGWLRPALTVPAFAVLIFGIALGYWQTMVKEPGTMTPSQLARVATPAVSKQADIPAPKNESDLQVKVKRVSSSVGPVMVYHRKHEEVPITIVWVFPQGSPIAGS